MSFVVTCPCSREIPVTSSSAGGTILCECGLSVAVPRLSELRKSVGQGRFESSAADVVCAMLRDGQLPWGDACAHSGHPTQDVFDISVECERPHSLDSNGGWLATAGMIYFGIFRSPGSSDGEVHGRQRMVYTPIRLREEFHARFRAASQRQLRRLLRTVPAYADLLDEFPSHCIFPRDFANERRWD